ncbi:recombinase family protein [Mesobacillus subterraneus]|uniref:recombinase family protein n=1 Tax=Mesobacillus subterraneus TaxID=285983 RepID=UPI0020419FD1|nr:recombinase family protein [Mesobacillus subterraneus]MCM3573334.1 recombinase family protein [Mesobacillus subterraneus]
MASKIKAQERSIKNVAIYIRVSTEEQAKEGYSISAQKQKLKAYCIAQGWEVSGVYVDEGISAKDMKRPQLQQMIKDIKAGEIDCVLVYRLDRLTRSVLDLYKLLETFEKHDCKFKSATEVFETTTALGRMFITIVAAMAQWERENTGERVSMGFHEKVRQGKYALNFRLFGYDLDLKTGKLSINEEEAKIVRLIVHLYLKEGMGANRICKYLNERNIKTRNGNTWGDKGIIQILKSPVYYGTIQYGTATSEGAAPAIIDKETHDLIQKTLELRRNKNPKEISSDYIFSGLLRCNDCGSARVGFRVYATLASGEKVQYKNYRCLKRKTGQCSSQNISEINLESAFLDYISTIDYSEVIDEVAATGEKTLNTPQNKVDIDKLQKELDKVEKRKKKWQFAWVEDMISNQDFDSRMEEEREKEEEIRAQLEQVDVDVSQVTTDKSQLTDLLQDIRRNWPVLSVQEKKSLTQMIVKQIHYALDEKKQVNIIDIDFY